MGKPRSGLRGPVNVEGGYAWAESEQPRVCRRTWQGVRRSLAPLPHIGLPGLASWSQVESRHLRQILDSCRWYFLRNPYDRWFKRLDQVIAGSGASYYVSNGACHLDLIPYATACKWTELSPQQRSSLIKVSGDTLGMLLRNSPVRLLVLNGRSVVELFEEVSRARLQRVIRREWNLPRKSGTPVIGMAYMGSVEAISDIDLGYRLCVIGYNHNIQSSYGVTAEAIAAIRDWIAEGSREAM